MDAPTRERRHVTDQQEAIERDRRLLRDPSTSEEIRLAVRKHLDLLGVPEVEDAA